MSKVALRIITMAGLAVFLVGWAVNSGNGQPPKADVAQPAKLNASVDTLGCRTCHQAANLGAASALDQAYGSTKFVRLNESVVWEQDDPHRRAYEVIIPAKNPIAKQMEMVLAAASADPSKYSVTTDVRCLTCHSTDLNPQSKNARLVSEFSRQENIGIACAGCHGVDPRWQTAHWMLKTDQESKYLDFRSMPPEKKSSDYGLRNLRDPATKSMLCASCHVGNPDEGKVVTHEMYAAGHPPLPPFEMLTFMEAEPRHWGYPMELSFLTDFAKKDPKLGWDTYRFWHKDTKEDLAAEFTARHVAVGAMMSLKAEMETIAADARGPSGSGGMVDFARLDCYACHHDLQYPSDRQKRGYEGAPGRPTLKAWVGGLPSIVAEHAATLPSTDVARLSGDFQSKWAAVRTAAIDRPFGNPAKLAQASEEMAKWCDAFVKATEKEPIYSKATANDLMNRIARVVGDEKRSADAEVAMHLTWAYRSLRQALNGDAAKLDVLKNQIPIAPRDLAGFKRKDPKLPVTVGEILADRQKVFNAFSASSFTEAFRKVADVK